jgi:diadenosine tetraphosphate (Ap4A) HIT family hydrolase
MIENLAEQVEMECRFCVPVETGNILLTTENFYVMLSLGPICEGYTLIISKTHIESCGELNNELGKEFDAICDKVKQIFSKVYGSCIMYEHGRAGSCLQIGEGSKHCYHAHMHCIPTNVSLNEIISKDFKPLIVSSYSDFRKECQRSMQTYLFVEDKEKCVYFVDREIRRQYLRYHLANLLGKPDEWDWIKYQNWEIIDSGRNKLQSYFK